jgi:hypothetical protein
MQWAASARSGHRGGQILLGPRRGAKRPRVRHAVRTGGFGHFHSREGGRGNTTASHSSNPDTPEAFPIVRDVSELPSSGSNAKQWARAPDQALSCQRRRVSIGILHEPARALPGLRHRDPRSSLGGAIHHSNGFRTAAARATVPTPPAGPRTTARVRARVLSSREMFPK